MQSICAYEYNYLYSSDFCNLFTEQEWEGFESTLDIEYFYDYSFGQPTGRAQGIGYLQELIARLEHHYILTSDSSVNSTIDNNQQDFPLNQKLYADFSHDDILISILTAMSLDYLRDPPDLNAYPPNPNRHFILSHLTPFAARLVTEVIGCTSPKPTAVSKHRTAYTATQYGYNPSTATHKFIRMRLNNGVLPLSTIRGGACRGRSDEMCSMDKFLESQSDAYERANYDFVCFGNYTIPYPNGGRDFDGTYNKTSS
jgi:Histidine phosphatase superfamily (branch 2)